VKNNFYNKPIENVYTKPNINSEVSTQILYGEKFKIISKSKNWVKIKTNFDEYLGFIKNDIFITSFKPSHKIFSTKSYIYKKVKSNFVKTKKYLYFSSIVQNLEDKKNYIEFDKNKWIKKKDLRKINHIEKNYKKILKLFLNTKYLWGGKSIDGIDCSALIQLFFKYNRKFFPRDTRDQIKYCKKKIAKEFSDGDIIFWKGHVGLCLDKKRFIHAYGPRKKVLIMPIKKTINLILKTAKLRVKKISNIKKY
jgi:hypothetical protein